MAKSYLERKRTNMAKVEQSLKKLLDLCKEFDKEGHKLPPSLPIPSMELLQQILDSCKDGECPICGWLACPNHHIEHFWKDGCVGSCRTCQCCPCRCAVE